VAVITPWLTGARPAATRQPATTPPPWERFLRLALTVFVLAGAAFITLDRAFHAGLLVKDTTINGGDTGAHVIWPAYLRDHVFDHGRISGWTPDWYAGYPIGRYYMPIPGLLIVLFDLVMPYNVAFKLVTTIGPLLLPVAAYCLARALKAPWPAPPIFAGFMLTYLFFTGYSILGGNLYSNAAGEFSFGIALAFALFFLAAAAKALDERQRLWLPALLLGLTVMSHVIVAMFVTIAGVLLFLMHRPIRNLKVGLAIGAVGALLSAVWTVPLWFTRHDTFDMGWGKITSEHFRQFLIPYRPYKVAGLPTELNRGLPWAVWLAAFAIVMGLFRLRRVTFELLAIMGVLAAWFCLVPDGARLWNARILPFYYLFLIMLAAMGVVELVLLIGDAARIGAIREGRADLARGAVAVVLGAATVGSFLVATWISQQHRDAIPSWYKWNNSGYETKAEWPEFSQLLTTMGDVGARYGCGRALWDPNDAVDGKGDNNGVSSYGTTLAPELLPYFTNGCIGSMEGLYFESSGTTPFHFQTVSELAKRPSNPVRDLQFGTIDQDFDRGVTHLRMLGVKYFLALSDKAKAKAKEYPNDLRLVAATQDLNGNGNPPGWEIYEVVGSDVVEPLQYSPIVVGDASADVWAHDVAQGWFFDRSQLDRLIVAGGPSSWVRAGSDTTTLESLPKVPLPAVQVTDVEQGSDWIRFHVSQPGVPVLVKMSYFPNFHADGADGPWKAGPNLMVVTPTANEVTVRWGQDPSDDLGRILFVLGLIGLVGLARWRPGPLAPPWRPEVVDADLWATILSEPGAAAGLGPLHRPGPGLEPGTGPPGWGPPVEPAPPVEPPRPVPVPSVPAPSVPAPPAPVPPVPVPSAPPGPSAPPMPVEPVGPPVEPEPEPARGAEGAPPNGASRPTPVSGGAADGQ
jgi:hypothetical protein